MTRLDPWTAALLPLSIAAVLVVPRRPWRLLRTVVTIVHEGGHVVTALLVGRRLSGVRVHADASGVTVSRGRPSGPGMVATVFAGYPAPSVLGLGAAALVAADRHAVPIVVSLAFLGGMLLAVRNLFGGMAILVSGAALVGIGWYAPEQAQHVGASALAWFLLLGGLRAVGELQRIRRSRRYPDSDADQLAALTIVPALVWVALFVLVALGAVLAATALLVPL